MRGNAGLRDPTGLARRLRRESTDVERLLWARLRGRRLNGWKFRRQVPIGRYVAGFCCPGAWLIVELDGGQHGSASGIAADLARTWELESCGYFVQRFWNREIVENLDGVCETILNLARGASAQLDGTPAPSPQPSPPRGEGARGRPVRNNDGRRTTENPLPSGERAG